MLESGVRGDYGVWTLTGEGHLLLLDDPCRVFQRLADIRSLQVRVLCQNLPGGHTRGNKVQDLGNRKAQSADAWFAPEYPWSIVMRSIASTLVLHLAKVWRHFSNAGTGVKR